MGFLRRVWLMILVLKGILKMANAIADKLQALTDQVTATVGVEASAAAFVNGVPALIQAAVDSALTLPELQAKLSDLQQKLNDSATALGAAVAAQTPAPEPPAGGGGPAAPVNPSPAGPAVGDVVVSGTGTVTDPSQPA